jgi:hypothetical protein
MALAFGAGEVLAGIVTKNAHNPPGHFLVSGHQVIQGFPIEPEQGAVLNRLYGRGSWLRVKGSQFSEYGTCAVFAQVLIALKDSNAAIYHYIHAGA